MNTTEIKLYDIFRHDLNLSDVNENIIELEKIAHRKDVYNDFP